MKNGGHYYQIWGITFLYNVSICWANDVANRGDLYQKINEPDILIWNVAGLHSHSEEFHLEKLIRLFYYIKKHHYYPFNTTATNIERIILYRETTPQAFIGTITGNYDGRNEQIQDCQSPLKGVNLKRNYSHHHSHNNNNTENHSKLNLNTYNLTTYLTYRQKLERSFLLSKNIPFLFIHDITLLQDVEQYIGFPDCSHFCDPGTPQIWNQMLYSYIITSPLVQLLQDNKNKVR